MTGIAHWNPFKEMDELQRHLNSLFTLDPARSNGPSPDPAVGQWSPVVDVVEDEKQYVIKAELPEVQRGDVKVTVENGILSITGERKFEKEENGKKYHRIERAYGSFTRRFAVPEDADDAKVGAEFKDGVLTVRLEKSEKARPRSIDVKVS